MKFSKFMGATLLTSAFAFAACSEATVDGDTDGDGNVSTAELQEVVSDLRPQAGKYSVTMNLVKVDIPGAPQQMLDAMGAMMNNTFEYCLTPEEADKGFEESLSEGQGDNCAIDKFELTGNDVDMAMTCSGEEQGNMQVTMTGSVSPTRSEIAVNTKGTLPQVGDTDVQMTMVQERLGECDS